MQWILGSKSSKNTFLSPCEPRMLLNNLSFTSWQPPSQITSLGKPGSLACFYLRLYPCDTGFNSIFTNLMFLCNAGDPFYAFRLFILYFLCFDSTIAVYAPVLSLQWAGLLFHSCSFVLCCSDVQMFLQISGTISLSALS